MTRMSVFGSALYLGFDELDQVISRQPKSANEGYPPYNVEHRRDDATGDDFIRITLAVAGFACDQLDISCHGNRLTVAGAQSDETDRSFLHRGIAARQFRRHFILAAGIEVRRAVLENGLLSIELARPNVEAAVKNIPIETPGQAR